MLTLFPGWESFDSLITRVNVVHHPLFTETDHEFHRRTNRFVVGVDHLVHCSLVDDETKRMKMRKGSGRVGRDGAVSEHS